MLTFYLKHVKYPFCASIFHPLSETGSKAQISIIKKLRWYQVKHVLLKKCKGKLELEVYKNGEGVMLVNNDIILPYLTSI